MTYRALEASDEANRYMVWLELELRKLNWRNWKKVVLLNWRKKCCRVVFEGKGKSLEEAASRV